MLELSFFNRHSTFMNLMEEMTPQARQACKTCILTSPACPAGCHLSYFHNLVSLGFRVRAITRFRRDQSFACNFQNS